MSSRFARQLFSASQSQRSLRLVVDVDRLRPTIELHRGWVCAVDVRALEPRVRAVPSRAEDQLQLLLEHGADAPAEEKQPGVVRHGACQPFHPLSALRSHYERHPNPVDEVARRLGQRPFSLTETPHGSALQSDERRVASVLALGPSRLADLEAARYTMRERLLHLVGFLDWLGLVAIDDPRQALIAKLGLPADVNDTELRRAYHRRVRELHPDLGAQDDAASGAEELVTLNRLFDAL